MNDAQSPTSDMPSRSAFTPSIYWLLLILVFFFGRFFDQWLSDQTFVAMNAKSGGVQLLIVMASLTFISSAFFPLLATLFIFMGWRLRDAPFWPSFTQMVKEQLRAFGSIMNWSLLLILPGLWKMLEYVLVPWVVALDPNYERGEVDALKESRRLFYRMWPWILGYAFVYMILIPFVLMALDGYRSFAETPLPALALTVVDLAFFVLFQWLLLKVWRKAHGAVDLSENPI